MEWRSIASPQAQDDVDKLFGDAIKFVAVELAHADDFAPFMMVISLAGEISVRRSAIATTPRDEVGVVRGLELPGDGDQLRARAAVLDVTALVPVAGDAIKIKIEHARGLPSTCSCPPIGSTRTARQLTYRPRMRPALNSCYGRLSCPTRISGSG